MAACSAVLEQLHAVLREFDTAVGAAHTNQPKRSMRQIRRALRLPAADPSTLEAEARRLIARVLRTLGRTFEAEAELQAALDLVHAHREHRTLLEDELEQLHRDGSGRGDEPTPTE